MLTIANGYEKIGRQEELRIFVRYALISGEIELQPRDDCFAQRVLHELHPRTCRTL